MSLQVQTGTVHKQTFRQGQSHANFHLSQHASLPPTPEAYPEARRLANIRCECVDLSSCDMLKGLLSFRHVAPDVEVGQPKKS